MRMKLPVAGCLVNDRSSPIRVSHHMNRDRQLCVRSGPLAHGRRTSANRMNPSVVARVTTDGFGPKAASEGGYAVCTAWRGLSESGFRVLKGF